MPGRMPPPWLRSGGSARAARGSGGAAVPGRTLLTAEEVAEVICVGAASMCALMHELIAGKRSKQPAAVDSAGSGGMHRGVHRGTG
jgi:hypothetical protein